MRPHILVIIPAFNEAGSIEKVMGDIPEDLVSEVVVVDNGSTDATADHARRGGATVLHEPKRGYGAACLKGIDYARTKQPDVVVFLDGDYSDFPNEMTALVNPILEQNVDLVIGSRIIGNAEPGALLPQARFGNWLATRLIRLFWNYTFTDLGPFRAVKFDKLLAMQMQDQTFGWTVEMQVKAAKMKLHCVEIPVSYRKRIGTSKITGTVSGTVKAGYKILFTIFKLLVT
ncbi:MAG: glycosyl hydrolase [[Candidatus Thermochlorobacteriaceae] bacterium GBChlB]|nr:MAG: glycosyl hydrolase [[Candidatus Thermochlorobacteriaceae] bacterium GBChlB]